jgi:hypothetical protein
VWYNQQKPHETGIDKEKGSEVLHYMFEHVSLGAFSFASRNKLIIWHSVAMCKANFYNRAEVVYTAKCLAECGGVLCALCKGLLTIHGSYRRHVRGEDGKRHFGWVAQGHCAACGKYPALIPDFIMPYKHFGAGVIETTIARIEEGRGLGLSGCSASGSTIYRWIAQFKERGPQAVEGLLTALLTTYDCQISELEMQNRGLLKQLARLLREFPVPEDGKIIGRANIILTMCNCGFL